MLNITLRALNQVLSRVSSSPLPSAASGSAYVLSERRVGAAVVRWEKHLPTVRPHYAVKCFPQPTLMGWLAGKGYGFDCASAREIAMVPKGSAIIYANPCKKEEDISFAQAQGVKTTVVDSVEEVDKLVQLGWHKKQGDALIRIRVDDAGSTMPFSAKFGAAPSDVATIAAHAHKKGLLLRGISFHVGSGCLDAYQYYKAIQASHYGLKTLLKQRHISTEQILDIGGGFTNDASFSEAAQNIKKAMADFPLPTVKHVIAEPGRFFASKSQDLFTQVIAKKKTSKGFSYTIDESLYGQFSCIPFDHARPLWIRVRRPEEAIGKRPRTFAKLFGRTCDSVDLIAQAEETEELQVGDWLWWPNMGAYTSVTATEFNGFPRPPTTVLSAQDPMQLPSPNEFPVEEWPKGVKYASCVSPPS